MTGNRAREMADPGGTGGPGGTARRELRLAVLLSLAGSGLVLLAASRTWLAYELPEAPPLPSSTERLTGALLVPGARPLALVALAGVAALFAARRGGRVLVGALVLLAGVGIVALDVRLLLDRRGTVQRAELRRQVALHVPQAPQLGPWPWLCLLGGLLVAAAGGLVAVRGRSWASLSAAYDAPVPRREAAAPAVTDKGVWDALDRGEDPTR